MTLLHWRDEFNTGIAAVDFEHRALFAIINDLDDKLRGGDFDATEEFFGALHDRIAAHFALEERVMQEHGYGGYAEHKEDHERLLDEIRELMEGHRVGDYSDDVDRLAQRLESWFSVHFNSHDVRLHRAIGDARHG